MMARISCRPCATLCPLRGTRHKVTRHKVTWHKVSGTRFLIDGCRRWVRMLILYCKFQAFLWFVTQFSEIQSWFILLFTRPNQFLTFRSRAEMFYFDCYLHTNLTLCSPSHANKNSFLTRGARVGRLPDSVNYNRKLNFYPSGPVSENSHMP